MSGVRSTLLYVTAPAAAPFDAALMAALQHWDPRIANPVEVFPGGMTPPDVIPS